MVVIAKKFTPQVLISAPRRSPATPNEDGSYALYTISKYSLELHSETKEIRVISLKTGQTSLFSDSSKDKEPSWLKENQVIWLKEIDGGETELWIGNAGEYEKNAYLAGSVPAPIFNFSTKELSDGSFAVAFNGKVKLDSDEIFNPEKATKALSSAREYTTTSIRWWDTYYTAERDTLWYTTLERKISSGAYKLAEPGLINVLKRTKLSNPAFPSSIGPSKQFDLSASGIILTALDPDISRATDIVTALYYIPLHDLKRHPTTTLQRIRVPGHEMGTSSSAVISPDGKAAAFLQTKTSADSLNRIFVASRLTGSIDVAEIFASTVRKDAWPLNPSSISWSNDGKEIYANVEERGRGKLFKLPVDLSSSKFLDTTAIPLTQEGVVSAYHPLTNLPLEKRLFVNTTTMMDSSIFTVLDTVTGSSSLISSASKHGSVFGLSSSQVSEFYFKGAGDYDVHSWVLKPSNFSKGKTYPLCMLIHGGPAGAWSDSWSTRWNPAVFAEQGYIIVAPNPTGSTGFGQELADGVLGQWGGRPYDDIVKCFEYVKKEMPFVDTDRAVALGASYGGYMMNWIAGQPLAKEFKTLVVHDGIFSIYNLYSSDETTMLRYAMGGTPWDNKAAWDDWDPAQYTQNWSTPMLIIHSDQDYRCPITEGLAVMNVCQLRGIESRFLNFPDENHFVLKHENSLRWHKTVLGWINKYAGVMDGVVLEPPISEPHAQSSLPCSPPQPPSPTTLSPPLTEQDHFIYYHRVDLSLPWPDIQTLYSARFPPRDVGSLLVQYYRCCAEFAVPFVGWGRKHGRGASLTEEPAVAESHEKEKYGLRVVLPGVRYEWMREEGDGRGEWRGCVRGLRA